MDLCIVGGRMGKAEQSETRTDRPLKVGDDFRGLAYIQGFWTRDTIQR